MKAYVYGARRDLPQGFEDFTQASRAAIVSIDMHQGHLADTPDCPCPAPRARELVAPIDAFHDQARRLGVPIIHVRTQCASSPNGNLKPICTSAKTPKSRAP